MAGKADPEAPDGGRPVVEWAFGAVSAVLVAGLIVHLGYQALFGDARPAALLVAVERIDRLEGASAVMVAIANRGDEAAAAVTVHASAPDASGGVARKQIEFDYVAAHAVRRGVFLFPGDVAADDLRVEVGGYVEP